MADFDSSLPIRTETDGDAVIKIVDTGGSNIAAVNASNEQLVKDTDVATALAGDITIADGGNSITVDAIDLDIRDITHVSDSIKVGDGTDFLGVNTDGSINVVVQDAGVSATEEHVFGTTVAGVPGTENTVVDITVTAAKTFLIRSVQAAASGKFKAELKTGVAASEVTKAVWFGSTAKGNEPLIFPAAIEVAATEKILLLITNEDKANADVYGFVNGNEV